MKYLVYGRETCPNTARQHIQGFVYFKNRQYGSYLSKVVPGAHFEPCRGTVEENINYCKKDDQFEEFGTPPTIVRCNNKFSEVVQLAERGDMESIKENHPGLFLRYKTVLKSIKGINKRIFSF